MRRGIRAGPCVVPCSPSLSFEGCVFENHQPIEMQTQPRSVQPRGLAGAPECGPDLSHGHRGTEGTKAQDSNSL